MFYKNQKSLRLIIVFFLAIFFSIPSTAAAKVYKLKMFSILGPGTAMYKAQKDWATWVKDITDGQLDIKISVAGAIVGASQSIDALSKGILQMSVDTAEYWAGKNPTMAVMTSLPCGFTDIEQYDFWFYKRGGIELYRKAYAKFNVYYLAPVYYPPEYLMSRKPIHSISEFKGKKLVFSGSLPTALFTKLGASVVYMPTAERMPALERGVIDGGDIGTPNTTVAYGAQKVAKYLIKPAIHQPCSVLGLLINNKAWSSLPDPLKKILKAASAEIGWRCYREYMEMDSIAMKEILADGVKIITLPDSDVKKIRKIALGIWNSEGKKTPLAVKILDSQISLMKEFGFF